MPLGRRDLSVLDRLARPIVGLSLLVPGILLCLVHFLESIVTLRRFCLQSTRLKDGRLLHRGILRSIATCITWTAISCLTVIVEATMMHVKQP